MATKKDVLCELIRKAAEERKLETVTFLSLQLAVDCTATQKEVTTFAPAAVQGVLGTVKVATPAVILGFVREYLRQSCSIGSKVSFVDIAINVESAVVSSASIDLNRTWRTSERRPLWRNHVSQAIEVLRREGVLVKSDKNSHYQVARRP